MCRISNHLFTKQRKKYYIPLTCCDVKTRISRFMMMNTVECMSNYTLQENLEVNVVRKEKDTASVVCWAEFKKKFLTYARTKPRVDWVNEWVNSRRRTKLKCSNRMSHRKRYVWCKQNIRKKNKNNKPKERKKIRITWRKYLSCKIVARL